MSGERQPDSFHTEAVPPQRTTTEASTATEAGARQREPDASTPSTASVDDHSTSGPVEIDPSVIPGYELLGELGRGGMGVVYKARQIRADRLVALKMVLAAGHASPSELARFRTEAEAVARLQHPGIVQVFEVGEHRGLPFFSMEFCPGGSLAAKLAGTPLPAKEAAALVETLAAATHAAHSRNIVHRDLKPANILLAGDGAPKVADFGLARRLDADSGQTRPGAVMGTPSYMAPELAAGQGHAAGPPCDVYALGAILYECLTGRPPFKGATTLETLELVRDREPEPVRRLNSRVPRDLETVCLKCLAKRPDGRYASARELADDLGRFTRGEPVLARPVGTFGRLARWARRRPATAALLVGMLALTAGGAAALVALRLEADAARAAEAEARAEQARKDKEQAEERSRIAREALEQVEDTLAENLFRPIGFDPAGPVPAELDSLRDLAASSSERVRLRFIDKALAQPRTAVRLARRAELVTQAVVGLFPQRRDTLAQLLTATLNDSTASPEAKLACVLAGAALETSDQAFCRSALPVALERLTGRAEEDPTLALADAVVALGARAGPDEVNAAARRIVAAIDRAINAATGYHRARAVTGLLPHVPPGHAAVLATDAVRKLLAAMDRTNETTSWIRLAEALPPLSARLTPSEAASALVRLFGTMGRTIDQNTLMVFIRYVDDLTARIGPSEAGDVARKAAAMLEGAQHSNTLAFRCQALARVARRMERGEAEAVCTPITRKLFETIGTVKEQGQSSYAIYALTTLAANLPPAESLAIAQRLVKERFALPVGSLAHAVGKLTGGHSVPEARTLGSEVAGRVMDAMGRTDNSNELESLARSLGELSPSLGINETIPAFNRLVEMLVKAKVRFVPAYLSRAAESLAAKFSSRDAAMALQNVLAAISKAAIADSAYYLGDLVITLAGRLDAADAGPATGQILAAMNTTAHGGLPQRLATAIGVLANRLPAAEAVAASTTACRGMIARLQAKTNDGRSTRFFAEAIPPLARRLDAAEAGKAAKSALVVLSAPMSFEAIEAMVIAVEALAARLEPAEAAQVCAAAAKRLAGSLERSPNPVYIPLLARLIGTLAERMEPAEGAAACGMAARRMLDALERTDDTASAGPLAGAVPALLRHLDPEAGAELSSAAARKVLYAMVLARPNQFMPTDHAGNLSTLARSLQVAQLGELLGHSAAVGDGRRVLLRELGRRAHPLSLAGSALPAIAGAGAAEALYSTDGEVFPDRWAAAAWLSRLP